MGKTVTSKIKRFPGTVTLRDPMTYDLVAKWEEAIQIIQSSSTGKAEKYALIERTLFPLFVELVEKWELTNVLPGVTRENFPNATPGTSAASIHALIGWLMNECQSIYDGNEDSDPNA
jgi:hypothetical protein